MPLCASEHNVRDEVIKQQTQDGRRRERERDGGIGEKGRYEARANPNVPRKRRALLRFAESCYKTRLHARIARSHGDVGSRAFTPCVVSRECIARPVCAGARQTV